jgi:hypothetical protein
MLVYFTAVWNILVPYYKFYGIFVRFVVIWYSFPHFGVLSHKKSGNPAREPQRCTAHSVFKESDKDDLRQ